MNINLQLRALQDLRTDVTRINECLRSEANTLAEFFTKAYGQPVQVCLTKVSPDLGGGWELRACKNHIAEVIPLMNFDPSKGLSQSDWAVIIAFIAHKDLLCSVYSPNA